MTVTIIVAGKNDIACNVLKYLTYIHDKNKILALPNENDTGIDNWQHSFKKTALENNIKIIKLNEAYTIENSIFFIV